MKISINSKLTNKPHGGGMQFANYMNSFLKRNGWEVVDNLNDKDIDIILHVNPFPFLTPQISAFSFFDAYKYKLKHPETIVVERVNEGDARKGTNYMDKLLVKAAEYSDFVIFIASWLKPTLLKNGLSPHKPNKVILNGADENIFNRENKSLWNGTGKLKIVTHHWSPNLNKGHEIYKKLDSLLNEKEYSEKFEFTYIGSVPKELEYKNTKIISPLSGKELADELKKHHVYITASKNEPAGMHHIEGALCGLPILYIDSGALPEYCSGFGLMLDENNLSQKLEEVRAKYKEFSEKMKNYNNTAEKMATEYLNTFRGLIAEKQKYKKTKNRILYQPLLMVYNLYYKIRFL